MLQIINSWITKTEKSLTCSLMLASCSFVV